MQAGAGEFVLAPVDASSVGGQVRGRARRRRRLIVDSTMMIPSEMIKCNMSNVADIVRRAVDLAPPTKKLMDFKESVSGERMFTVPGCHLGSSRLLKVCVTIEIRSNRCDVM